MRATCATPTPSPCAADVYSSIVLCNRILSIFGERIMNSTIDTARAAHRDIVQDCIEEVRREHMMRRLRLHERYLGEMDIPLKAGGVLAFILFWVIGWVAPVVVTAAYFVLYLPVCAIARANAERALRMPAHRMAGSVLSLVAAFGAAALAFAP